MRENLGIFRRRRSPVPFATFFHSLVLHAMSSSGSLADHLGSLSGIHLSNAAVHQQRAALPWEWFEGLFAHVLQPIAKPREHPDAFYGALRLLAVDGTAWSLRNTTAIEHVMPPRHGNQKGASSAFHKLQTALLVELGTHQPLAVACQQAQGERPEGQGEITLAKQLLCALPALGPSLLIADRLYGGSGFISALRTQSESCQVLIRVAQKKSARALQKLSDGSLLVEVKVSNAQGRPTAGKLMLREVQGEVLPDQASAAAGIKPLRLRLWTSLLDEKQAPAKELLELYAQRWEAELFFRELKAHVGREQLLRAGTLQGAQAELGALIIAAALLAEQRVQAATKEQLPPKKISVTKLGAGLANLLPLLAMSQGIISDKQRAAIIKRWMKQMQTQARIAPRRPRRCERGLRKPVSPWPCIRTRCAQPVTWACRVSDPPQP